LAHLHHSCSSASPAAHRDLPSFPTRRSSDLPCADQAGLRELAPAPAPQLRARGGETILLVEQAEPLRRLALRILGGAGYRVLTRSEEHTSELQSRENLVCRLLLEKKKHNKYK